MVAKHTHAAVTLADSVNVCLMLVRQEGMTSVTDSLTTGNILNEPNILEREYSLLPLV